MKKFLSIILLSGGLAGVWGAARPAETAQTATPTFERSHCAKYYAACNTNHVKEWFGPDRTTQADAQRDATAHDSAQHKGRKTAGVIGPLLDEPEGTEQHAPETTVPALPATPQPTAPMAAAELQSVKTVAARHWHVVWKATITMENGRQFHESGEKDLNLHPLMPTKDAAERYVCGVVQGEMQRKYPFYKNITVNAQATLAE